jgi:hypothetical protein
MRVENSYQALPISYFPSWEARDGGRRKVKNVGRKESVYELRSLIFRVTTKRRPDLKWSRRIRGLDSQLGKTSWTPGPALRRPIGSLTEVSSRMKACNPLCEGYAKRKSGFSAVVCHDGIFSCSLEPRQGSDVTFSSQVRGTLRG